MSRGFGKRDQTPEADEFAIIHVYPPGESKSQHGPEGRPCPCKPVANMDDAPVVMLHRRGNGEPCCPPDKVAALAAAVRANAKARGLC